MNTTLECLENEAFNELINFSFEEVRAAFNQFRYYVPLTKEDEFASDLIKVKNKYAEEVADIEKYAKEEYAKLVRAGVDIPEYDDPVFMIKAVELQTKSQLIDLIKKYFNRDVFERNKPALYSQEIFKKKSVETPHELWVTLNVHKKHIYSLLSIIGYYQRSRGYFLSAADFFKICSDYSRQVCKINEKLGLGFQFFNIFISDQRLDSTFINVDNLSLLALLQPYLKHNTNEIKKIIEIMMKNLRGSYGGIAWDSTIEEVNQFIDECEKKGIMKRL